MTTVIFACVHNAGRSQMAAALFNRFSEPSKARALSAGTEPGQRVHPEVVEVMRERDIDLTAVTPRKLTDELSRTAQWLITMGCGEQCPTVAGLQRDDWPLEDPKGKPRERVREIRDEVERKVRAFLASHGWLRQD
jgi:arsenate reductase